MINTAYIYVYADCVQKIQVKTKEMGQKKAKKKEQPKLFFLNIGAGNEVRTRDPNHGKVMLYQLSYSRIRCETL